MRKKITFVMVLMFVMTILSAAYVEIGDGNTASNYIPVHGYYEYSWSRTIYLQTDLATEIEIDGLSYNLGNPINNYTMGNQSYYMKHTTASSFDSAEYVDPTNDDSYQLVYQGDVTYNGDGWQDINFDTIFE